MPQETERPIEKLLRAFAKKRREDAGSSCDLHPATRRMLQAEVTRTFGAPSAQPGPGEPFLRFWPKLAWGLAACAVLIVGIWLLRPQPPANKPATLLAQNERQTTEARAVPGSTPQSVSGLIPAQPELRDKKSATELETIPRANPAPLTLAEDRAKVSSDSAAQRVQAASAVATGQMQSAGDQPLATRSLAAVSELENELSLNRKDQASEPKIPAPVPASPAAGPAQLALGAQAATTANLAAESIAAPAESNVPAQPVGGLAGTPAVFKESFQRVAQTTMAQQYSLRRAEPKAKSGTHDNPGAPTAILASFRFEQTGAQLRVIDYDGSIYTGNLQSGPAETVAVPTRLSMSNGIVRELDQQPQPAAADLVGMTLWAPKTYFFRVSGTNVTLKQRVTFLGKLTQTTNTSASDERSGLVQLRGTAAFQSPAPEAGQAPAVIRRVSGKAIVGGKTEIPIEAVSPSAQEGKNE
jgi:hypothetical protein